MKRIFHSNQNDLKEHNGKTGTIIRELTEDEADLHDVGMMYKFKLSTGEVINVFEDEIIDKY